MKVKPEIMQVLNAAGKARQLSALLQNIFEHGTDGCNADDELIGLAYDISGKISSFLSQLEEQENR